MEMNRQIIKEEKRIEVIDRVKGIGILCIVFGHVFPMTIFTQWLFAFHVPLFFLVSGFTYRFDSNKKRFFRKKLCRLMVPYIIFSIISILLLWVMAKVLPVDEESRILPNLMGMLWGNSNGRAMAWNTPLWFLPCMFCSVVLMDLFETVLKRVDNSYCLPLRLAFVGICWTVGIILNTVWFVYLPWHLETAVFLVGFSELGLVLRHWGMGTKRNLSVLSILVLTVIGVAASMLNGWTDIRTHTLGHHSILLVVTAVCFSCAVFGASEKLGRCHWLSYFGLHSISILVMHKFPILFFRELIPGVQELLNRPAHPAGIVCGLAITVVTVGLCLLAEKIIMAVFPIAFGLPSAKRR